MTRTSILIAAAVMLAGVPAAAHAQNREEMQIYADIRMLEDEVAKLQLSVNQLAEMNKATNKRLDDQADTTTRAFANQLATMKDQGTAISAIQAKLNDNTVRVSELNQEIESIHKGFNLVTQQLNTLTNLLQTPVNPTASADSPTPTPAPANGDTAAASSSPDSSASAATSGPLAPITPPQSPKRYFDQAMNEYMADHRQNAIDGFNDFLQRYPDSADAAEAQYYIGKSYYQGRNFQDAIKAYQQVIDKYKTSDYVVQAYYGQALSYAELNQAQNKQRIFDIILARFPNSTEATIIRQRPDQQGKH